MVFKKIARAVAPDSWVTLIDELYVGLSNLTLRDNFSCSRKADVALAAGAEVAIEHGLRTVPEGYLITKQTGNATIIAGDTAWDSVSIYLKNPSVNDAVITVYILR